MHRIKVEFGIEPRGDEKPVRVLLDDIELSGVSEIRIVSNEDGVTSVAITLIAVVVAEIALPAALKPV
jgi:hypothetical protein